MKSRRTPLGLALVAGFWLLAAPGWMPAYASSTGFVALHSVAIGLLVAEGALFAMAKPARWNGAVLLALSLWLLISPFLIGFIRTAPGPAWNQMLTGMVLLVCSFVVYQFPAGRRSMYQS